jgi:hypothetical protein
VANARSALSWITKELVSRASSVKGAPYVQDQGFICGIASEVIDRICEQLGLMLGYFWNWAITTR